MSIWVLTLAAVEGEVPFEILLGLLTGRYSDVRLSSRENVKSKYIVGVHECVCSDRCSCIHSSQAESCLMIIRDRGVLRRGLGKCIRVDIEIVGVQ